MTSHKFSFLRFVLPRQYLSLLAPATSQCPPTNAPVTYDGGKVEEQNVISFFSNLKLIDSYVGSPIAHNNEWTAELQIALVI